MAEESFQEKTEKATPKRREKAREEGQVAKSIEIPSVFVLLVGVSILYMFGHFIYKNLLGIMRHSFTFTSVPVFDLKYCLDLLAKVNTEFILLVAPVMGAVFLTALAANFFQVGFTVSFKAIAPKLSKFNMVKGFKRLFSLRSFVELVKSIIKLLIIGIVSYFVLKSEIANLLKLHDMNVASVVIYILKGSFKISIWVILIMIVVAVLDFAYQKWQFEEQIKMTKQEVKEESKQTEGDPQVKARIRSIQYQAARKRMMQQVPKADVVVTNPTHLALAIRYDPASMSAPRVVAKGASLVAERIKKIAQEHHIPVIENKELAQNLYKIVEVGNEVPFHLYRAVAELLAYVYKLKGKTI